MSTSPNYQPCSRCRAEQPAPLIRGLCDDCAPTQHRDLIGRPYSPPVAGGAQLALIDVRPDPTPQVEEEHPAAKNTLPLFS